MRNAIIGLGSIGRVHAKVVRELYGEPTAVCDVDTEKFSDYAESAQYTDYRVMLEEARPEVVHICTPHYLHAEMIIECLKRDINVLCEKPMCMKKEEIDAVLEAEKNSSAKLGICLQNRYNAPNAYVKDYLADKEILAATGNVVWHRGAAYYNSGAWRGKWATEGGGGEPPAPTEDYQVTEWGWDDGTSERELVYDVGGDPVLNSAGDPFDSVPQVESPAPTFTKVMKFASRRQYAAYNCTINDSQLVIGNMTCAPYTLLATISEKRNIGDENWPYTYTVRLRYRTNKVKRGGDTQIGEIGWNVAIADTGMREIDTTTGKLKLIQVPSAETGQPATVTSPELLDGAGHAVARSAGGSAAEPYVLVFGAYDAVSFPSWFYTEPPALTSNP